jgi:hypothetical protein
MNNLPSFEIEKMNLFAAAPENMMKFSPRIHVLNTLEEYLVVLFGTKFSTAPSWFAAKN